MIKPSDLPSITTGNPEHRDAIEAYVDDQIRRFHKSGSTWPLIVQDTRDGWSNDDVEQVLEKYRAAGWTVISRSTRFLATIDRPR